MRIAEYWKPQMEKRRENVKQWRAKNTPRWRAYMREHYRINATFRVATLVRNRIRQCVVSTRKSAPTEKLLGCPFGYLRLWLEAQFKPGMTWDNYGSHWHIDHIRPCASFDLADPVQQRQCFHYTNLQPLWAEENLRKSDKWQQN